MRPDPLRLLSLALIAESATRLAVELRRKPMRTAAEDDLLRAVDAAELPIDGAKLAPQRLL